MDELKKGIWKVEMLWWMFTALAVVIVMLPIYLEVPDFPFVGYNILYIVLAITFTRYIFLLKYTPVAYSLPFKIVIPLITLVMLLLLQDGLAEFQRVLDEEGFMVFMGDMSTKKATGLAKYIRAEYFFFGVSTIICSIVLPFRMIVSIWRQKNRGTV